MANRYWVGNGGNWDDTSHWSTSSGGSGGASVPTQDDDVYFDANSFTTSGQTVHCRYAGNPHYCKNVDWSGVTDNPTWLLKGHTFLPFVYRVIFDCFGSVTLVSEMTLDLDNLAYLRFYGTAENDVFVTKDHPIEGSIYFSQTGTLTIVGEYTQGDE